MEESNSHNLIPRLGLFSASMVVVGCIIGSGVFKKISPMSLKLQSPTLVILCWLLAGVISFFGALTYAEVAGRLAQTGGLYAYLKTMFGPFPGYLYGWACFSVIQSSSIASVAHVFAEAFLQIWPCAIEAKWIAAAGIFTLTGINCLGLIFGARFENTMSVVKVLGIALVTVLGFAYHAPIHTDTLQIVSPPVSPTGINLWGAMLAAMLSAFWAYDGLNNIGFIGGEIKNPKKNIPLALTFGMLGIIIVYLAVNISYFHALPMADVLTIAQNPDKIFAVEMLLQTYGPNWALLVTVLILISTMGTANGTILSSARIYFAMARDGLFFKGMGKLTKSRTPVIALVVQSFWAAGLVFLGTFDELTDMLIFASFIFYGLGAVGLFVLRKNKIETHGFKTPSFVPAFYILFCFSLVVVFIFQDPIGALKGLGLIATGLPLYFWFTKKTARV